MSQISATTPNTNPHDVARVRFADYAVSESRYSAHMADLYSAWADFNARFFSSKLKAPHLTFGRTAPHALAFCKNLTDWGGVMQITISERLVLARSPMILRPYPSPGTRLLLLDLLLHEQVHQYMFEVIGDAEEGYRGHGPRFANECNRIGKTLGLPPVVTRHRTGKNTTQPVANSWPLNVRPAGYYQGDVALQPTARQGRILPPSRNLGIYEFFLSLLLRNETDRLWEILARHVDWLRMKRSPALAAAERGPRDASGNALPVPAIDPYWLQWNDGCVGKIAACIQLERGFEDMPILADALEEAGCTDQLILEHCRIPAEHTHACWVLRAVGKTKQ